MKNLLVIGATGIGLFSATVVGLLAAQGRLNHAGTKGIPVLNSFFPEPPPAEETDGEKKDGEGDAAHGDATKDGAKSEGSHGKAPAPHAGGADGHGDTGHATKGPAAPGHADKGSHGQGAHPKPIVEYVEGRSIKEPPAEAGGGHGEAPDAGHGDAHKATDVVTTPKLPDDADPEKIQQERHKREFTRTMERLVRSDEGYNGPGDLFDLKKISANFSVEEVNDIIGRAKKVEQELELKRAELANRERSLETRERDIADRQDRVSKLLSKVDAERAKVEKTIEDFNRRVLELRSDEESSLKEAADTIGSLDAEAAKKLILDYWRTPEGQNRAIKILAVMEKSKVDEILATMETTAMREVLEKRMTVVRTGKKKR